MNTNDLRKASRAVFLATDEIVAENLSNKLIWAADEIDGLCKTERVLLNLLAVLHRDDGHYTEEHGIGKSIEDATIKYLEVVQTMI